MTDSDYGHVAITLASSEEVREQSVLAALARIYNQRCYTGEDGTVNPFDQRYTDGGGHFARQEAWFAENLGAGSRLMLVRNAANGGDIIGFALFYVDPSTFPRFATDAVWPCEDPAIGPYLAYTYLFIMEQEWTGAGYGWRLMSKVREQCAADGCRAIIHEYFVRPVTNLVSALIHHKMSRRWGAIDTGRTATHTVKRASGDVTIVYAQYLIPTRDSERMAIDSTGKITFVPA